MTDRFRLVQGFVMLSLLVGCGTVMPPSPPSEAVAVAQAVHVVPGAVFLPPIGPPVDTSYFYAGADLTIQVYALTKTGSLGALLSTIPAPAGDRYYEALWRVADTVEMHPTAARVRVMATATDLAGSAATPACRGQRACVVGSFDAQVTMPRNGKIADDLLDLTATQSLPIKVYVQAASNRPTALSQLTRLSDGLPFEGLTNCLVNEFTMPGQGLKALGAGLKALGAVGGLFVLPADPGPTYRYLPAAEAGAWAAEIADTDGAWSGAIVVVDDFGSGGAVVDVGPALWPTFVGVVEPVDPAETDALLTQQITDGSLSHGALVFLQTIQMVEAAGFVLVARPSADFAVFASADGFPYLVVAAVDVGGSDLATTAVAARIQRALAALQHLSDFLDDDFAVLDVAVNMSFVIVPCSVVDDYEASVAAIEAMTTFEDYVAALGADNAVALDFYAELKALLLMPFDEANDPVLHQAEACQATASEPRTPIVPWTPIEGRDLKVESIHGPGEYAVDDGDLSVVIRVYDTPAGQLMDWSSNRPIGSVFVKGGTDGNTYAYTGATSGTGLHAPMAKSGKFHDVSHIVFAPVVARPLAFLDEGAWPTNASWLELVTQGTDTVWDCARGRVNYVASSGNFGLAYPLFPAAWDVVIGVSSQDALQPDGFGPLKSSFSNSGEVMAPGALYELSRNVAGTQIVAYAGTSFSSPVVSVFTALDLMRDVPACGTATWSRLTVAPDTGNASLPDAVTSFCSP